MGIFNKTSYLQNQNDWRCVDLIFFSLYVSHKGGRFVKSGAAVQYQQQQKRLRYIRKSEETGNDCLPSFDTDSD